MAPNLKKFNKLLVANRGEIAIRIFRAADELHIRTVAIYTYEDRYSLHRYKADEAYQIGKDDDPLKPYLDIDEIIRVAKYNKIDAIHPGYGFLSENVQFAKRCRDEGIIFVGPEPETMQRLGDKVSAKEVAREIGIPVIEDNQVPLTDADVALKEAKRIGFPLILKAAAGGGGRGMRVLREESEVKKAYEEARREAGTAFGIDTIFMEKLVESPKHIEVQVLGDNHGNIVHLFERDCSVQRRFQKVVEIAPSPAHSDETRQKLFDHTIKMARHVKYNNAGTFEFLVDPKGDVFFIEVNPRLQVEHTITEEITGIDIVRSQILIAQGFSMEDPELHIPKQENIGYSGFAIQCRITTEDPTNKFAPDTGTIIAYRNAGGFGIRLDEGSSYPGVEISPFFDSLLVKVSSWGRSLRGAAARLDRTLREFRIRGVKTNIPFLQNVINHETFLKGEATVTFIDTNPELFQYPRKGDRGTKVLKYIADIVVNGNPDVKFIDPNKQFRSPKIPASERGSKCPQGTRDKLQELGRKKFTEWLKDEKAIHYTDTTFRDAHQSLLATRMRTLDMLMVAKSFARNHPEVFSMEVWGGATFDVSMRFLHEDPWERLQLLRKAIPNILFQMLIRSSNAVGYTAYPDNVVAQFIETAGKEGIDIFRIFDSLNWIEAMKPSIKTVIERTDSLAEACVCYTGDILDPNEKKYTLQYYLDLARQLEDEGAHILAIKDMAGLLKPYSAEVLVRELKKSLDIPVHLHTHDTSSLQPATYLKAIEAGVDVVDVALGSMSGLTSQPNFNSIVAMMQNHERELPINLHKLNEFSNYWEDVREFYYPFESGLKAGTAEVFEHEIPGGQYSNLRPQARALGLEDKFETVKKNYKDVNELLGNIVKVTPSSKVVGDLALYMTSNNLTAQDILERGEDISFPDSVIQFFKGELGQPHGGFPEKLQKIILKDEKPYTDRPNKHMQPVDLEKGYKDFQEKYPHTQYNDYMSYLMYPKVFDEYYNFRQEFGDVWVIPTPAFFYGLKPEEEIIVKISKGKNIIVKYLHTGQADEEGNTTSFFELNGQTRRIIIKDKNVQSTLKSNRKVSGSNDVGAPLQGKLSKILVEEGAEVAKNTPLFVIEAMKMENTVTAPRKGKINNIILEENTMVQQDDLVLVLE